MVPEVLLTIDIVPLDQTMDEKTLLELIAPCLNHLKALKGSFDRNIDIQLSVDQFAQEDGSVKRTARFVVLISVGMQRAQHLQKVIEAYCLLFRYELPTCLVNAHSEILKFQ
jgi:hypothetical protein